MPQEDVLQFYSLVERNQELYYRYLEAMSKYKGKPKRKLKKGVIFTEVIQPIAREAGFEFTIDELRKLQTIKGRELSDELLEKVVAAKGAIYINMRILAMCNRIHDKELLRGYYSEYPTSCSYFIPKDSNLPRYCSFCQNIITAI